MPVNLVLFSNPSDVEQLRKEIAELKKKDQWNVYSQTIRDTVRDALLARHHDVVRLFLDEGVEADSCVFFEGKKGGKCLVVVAAQIRDLLMVKLLVGRGAVIKNVWEYGTLRIGDQAMKVAVGDGSTEIVAYLLENGADADGAMRSDTRVPVKLIGEAALNGFREIVALLADHGADIATALEDNQSKHIKDLSDLDRKIEESTRNSKEVSEEEKKTFSGVEKHFKIEEEIQQLMQKRNQIQARYMQATRLLLDYAQGVDLGVEERQLGPFRGLSILDGLDVSGFNFVGISVNGKPITQQMLETRGIKGVENAFFKIGEIAHCRDISRQEVWKARLERSFVSKGKRIVDGVVNLVPLASAVKIGDRDTVALRLSAGEDPNQRTGELYHCLDSQIVIAARCGYLEVVKLLAEHPKIDPKSIVSAALDAKRCNFPQVAEYLTSIQGVDQLDERGNAPLHNAVFRRNIEEVRRLIASRANLSLCNEEGWTPLDLAIGPWNPYFQLPPHTEILKILLSEGADPNKSRERSPLEAAVTRGTFEMVKTLLPLTIKKNQVLKREGKIFISPWYTRLIHIAFTRSFWREFFELLKKEGERINFDAIEEPFELTLLQELATSFPSFNVSKLEDQPVSHEEKKARVDTIDRCNAQLRLGVAKLDYLLENGAKVSLVTKKGGNNSLHLFLQNSYINFAPGMTEKVLERFLSTGLDVNAVNENGDTPFDIADKRRNDQAANYLKLRMKSSGRR